MLAYLHKKFNRFGENWTEEKPSAHIIYTLMVNFSIFSYGTSRYLSLSNFERIKPVQMTISNARKNPVPIITLSALEAPLIKSLQNTTKIHSKITTANPIRIYFKMFFIFHILPQSVSL